jgi:Mitochondrial carrier protein
VIPSFQGDKEAGATQAALCGCSSGALAAAVTTPLDVIKTRLMLGAVRTSALRVLAFLGMVHMNPVTPKMLYNDSFIGCIRIRMECPINR